MATVGFAGLFPAHAVKLETRTLVLTLSAQAALVVLDEADEVLARLLVPTRSRRLR
jgi:hypothetical protein